MKGPFFRCFSVRERRFRHLWWWLRHDYVLADSSSGGCRAGCDQWLPVTAAGRFVSTGMSFLGLVVGIATAVSAINIFNGPTLDIEQLRFEPTTPLVASFFFLVAIATFALPCRRNW